MNQPPRILFCNCTYAQVVPKEVKAEVLKKLCEAGIAFDAVADLCEMSARKDPGLRRCSDGGALKIAACYPRAVKWLFAAAGAPLQISSTEVVNMRASNANGIVEALLSSEIKPNVPAGKVTNPGAQEVAA